MILVPLVILVPISLLDRLLINLCSLANPRIFQKADSYVAQFAAIICDVVSRSHRQYIHPKGNSDVVSCACAQDTWPAVRGAGNQNPDIKFVWPKFLCVHFRG